MVVGENVSGIFEAIDGGEEGVGSKLGAPFT